MSVLKSSFVDTDVRLIFEKHSVEETRNIHRKVNHDVERKKEELRMLVGERYRDLIDAADTIGTMKNRSATVSSKLVSLREKLNLLPVQLTILSSSRQGGGGEPTREIKLSKEELEVAAELKLAIEIPRQIQHFLEKEELFQAFHYLLLFTEKLTSNGKCYKWTFLQNSGKDLDETALSIAASTIAFCEDAMEKISTPAQKLSECIIIKENLTKFSCEQIISNWLTLRLKLCETSLKERNSGFILVLASSIQALYQIFIDPELYNSTAKRARKPEINISNFYLIFHPRCVDEFSNESIKVENPPRASRLAEIIQKSFISPLKVLLELCYNEGGYLQEFETLSQLSNYRQYTSKILTDECEDLMRIVLGTSTSLWLHVFSSVFQLKSQAVISCCIENISDFLRNDGFPKFEIADSNFDLVNFIWKVGALTDSANLEKNLRLNCLTPNVSELCANLETRFQALLTDFQALGDSSFKEYISLQLLRVMTNFIQDRTLVCPKEGQTIGEFKTDWFLGRFSTALMELCPTLWKLLEKENAIKLKQTLVAQSEKCWNDWSKALIKSFEVRLEEKMSSLVAETVALFMPVGEMYKSEAAEAQEDFEPSVRIPIQLSHIIHTLLFSVCLEIAKIGPQSIPKTVRDNLRLSLGQAVITFYEDFLKEESDESLTAQMSVQFIFDLKFVQWFHPNLSGSTDSLALKLKALVDPFDWDIVNPRLTVNLKRFLFENHLTLGLMFSEESHGFIAQNFKTKQNLSFPISRNPVYNQLPLLPV